MKRMWLFVGIVFGVLLQYIFNSFWYLSTFQNVGQYFYATVNNLSLATLIGFFYLHVPEGKRSLRTGITIGSIIGLLIGIFKYSDSFVAVNNSINFSALEIVRILLLGVLCGIAMSISERQFNPNRTIENK